MKCAAIYDCSLPLSVTQNMSCVEAVPEKHSFTILTVKSGLLMALPQRYKAVDMFVCTLDYSRNE